MTISAGELYDLRDEIKTADADRLRVIAADLLDNNERLGNLIGEMADFRSTKQHEAQMAALKKIGEAAALRAGEN